MSGPKAPPPLSQPSCSSAPPEISESPSGQGDDRQTTPAPDAFKEGHGQLPNNPLVAAGVQAIWKGGAGARSKARAWTPDTDGAPSYRHNGNRGGSIVVYPGPSDRARSLSTVEALWSFVEGLSPFTADVALAVLAQMAEPTQGYKVQYPLLESIMVSADDILRYKGIQRRGTERRALLERIHEEMERLRRLQFDVESYPAFNHRTGKVENASWQGDRLFDIVRVERYQESLSGEKELIQVAWSVRAGQWARWWLNARGRVYLTRMARVLLEMDHQGKALAKKIGQRIVLLAGAIQELKDLRIEGLLEDVGELPVAAKRSKDWAGRTRDRFDEAMLALLEAGIFSRVEWPDGCGPQDPDRGRGWVHRWLNARVRIQLPEDPPELPSQPRVLPPPRRSGRRPGGPSPEQRIDGSAVRQARIQKGLSQQALADQLGISVSYLSLVENGRRIPSRAFAVRLRAWLEEALQK
jgi:DNA-binding XRE family transcriptional regulator